MTDNEIIKALERCADGSGTGLIKATIDLINRQKAEIERLEKESIGNCEMAIAMRSDHNLDGDCLYCIDKAKAEAIKEFEEKSEHILIEIYKKYHDIANRPKKESDMYYQGRAEAIWECISINRKLVKEMVGDDDV